MSDAPTYASVDLVERIRALGFACDSLPNDRWTSALAALACLPMYMVANVHAWTDERQFSIPLLDLPGSEQILEAFSLGQQEAQLAVGDQDRKVLRGFLTHARASDRIVYEYAIETLSQFLREAPVNLASELRAAIGRGIVAVAEASGKGLLGSGDKVSAEERLCIQQIAQALDLAAEPRAAAALDTLGY
jgi:hypothetical protein